MPGLLPNVGADLRRRAARQRSSPAEQRDADERRGRASALLLRLDHLTANQRAGLETPSLFGTIPGDISRARERAYAAISDLAVLELGLDVDSALKRAHLDGHPWAREVTLDGALAAASQDLLPAGERHYLSAAWAQIMGVG